MKPVLRNGNTYLEVQSLDWKFTTSKMHLKMNNLFNGDKVLGEYNHNLEIISSQCYHNYFLYVIRYS